MCSSFLPVQKEKQQYKTIINNSIGTVLHCWFDICTFYFKFCVSIFLDISDVAYDLGIFCAVFIQREVVIFIRAIITYLFESLCLLLTWAHCYLCSASSGHGLHMLTAVLRLSQPSSLRGMVECVSVFRLSNNDNNSCPWWYGVAGGLTWFEAWWPSVTESALIKWNRWILTVALVMINVGIGIIIIVIIHVHIFDVVTCACVLVVTCYDLIKTWSW